MNTKVTLKMLMANPHRHACWLNSLSYLEYRGFRKIVRSQPTSEMNMDMLLHTLEEVRHSTFFKRQAMKIGGGKFNSYDDQTLICPSAIKSYFFNLDQDIASILAQGNCPKVSRAAYSLVTWVIELRALSIYQEYNLLLKELGFDFSLNAILKEEAHHLQEMISDSEIILKTNGLDPERFNNIEHKYFLELWSTIERSMEVSL